MPAVELATGYVTLTVETTPVAKQIGRVFAGTENAASSSGRKMGQAMAKGFQSGKPNVDQLRADVEAAQKRVAAGAEQAAKRQEAAKRKVEIAQAKLNETTEKYGPKSSQALTAADRLNTAEQRLDATTMANARAQDKLQAELKQTQDRLSNAEGQTTKYAKGWKGLGQKLKAQVSGAFKSVKNASDKQAAKAGKSGGGRFSTAFKGALAGLAAGVSIQAIGQQITKSITNAGNLEQSIGAIDSVFKKSAGQMHSWAKSAAVDVGLTQNEFNELGTLIGAQLKNGGMAMDELGPKTKSLITLGADLSSMFGGTTREAVEALSSALKGEMDPIEKYGITMNAAAIDAEGMRLGLEKTGKTWSTSAKQAIVMSLATKQSADAQGNFAKESDTFAHKQQVMKAQWENLTTAIGGKFLPIMTNVFGFISEKAIPFLDEMFRKIGESQAVKLLGDAFRNTFDYVKNDVIPAITSVVNWFQSGSAWADAIKGAVIGIGAAWAIWTAAVKTWAAVTKIAAAVQLAFNAVMAANPITVVILLIAALVGAIVYLYKNNETARRIIDKVWAAIRTAFEVAIGAIITAFKAVKTWFTVTLPNAWNTLMRVNKQVWDGIWTKISSVWAVVKAVFKTIVDYLRVTLGTAFQFVWDKVKKVFNGIKSIITSVWNLGIKPIFDVIKKVLKGDFVGAFETARDAIENIWRKVANIVRKPINFVINTVYTKGIKKVFDKVAGVVGIKPLPVVEGIPAYAKGGLAKKGWALVGEEGPELVNFENPGRVYTASQTSKMLSGSAEAPAGALDDLRDQGVGLSSHNGIGGFWSNTWDNIKSVTRSIGDAVKSGLDFVRGGLAKAAEWVLGPLKSSLSSELGTTGFGGLASGLGKKAIDGVISFLKGEDDKADEFGGGFTGKNGGFYRPVGGRITSLFGSSRGRYPHAGTDLAVPIGTAVRAAWNGVVKKAGWNVVGGRSGIGMLLEHANGKNTYYGHLSKTIAKIGETVKAGQVIAKSGNTGRSTGPHLHFETWQNGRPYNNISLLTGGGSSSGRSRARFDTGGWLMPGVTPMVENFTGKPEAIYTAEQNSALQTLARIGGDTVTAGDDGNIYIDTITISASEIKDIQEISEFFKMLRRKTRQNKGGN